MDFDRVLEKCGNFGPYQWVVLLLFGYTNIMSSMHYFSQTLISFTPEHWCYHPQMENKSFDEIHDIYQQLPSPHCTMLDSVDGNGSAVAADGLLCREWIYKKEAGYESITMEVSWKSECGVKKCEVVDLLKYAIEGYLSGKHGIFNDIQRRTTSIFLMGQNLLKPLRKFCLCEIGLLQGLSNISHRKISSLRL